MKINHLKSNNYKYLSSYLEEVKYYETILKTQGYFPT